jgi:pimeloyl-ACP methyl ester carboxylesterase
MVLPEESRPGVQTALLGEVGGALTLDSVRHDQPSWSEEDVFRLVRASQGISPHVVRRILADNRPWDLVDRAASWTTPVTILAADPSLSELFSDADAHRIEDVCDTVRIVTVAEAGHSIHRDAPETVLAALDHAIGELPPH